MKAIRFVGAVAAVALVCTQGAAFGASAESPLAKADEAFKKKRYEQALKEYDEVLKGSPKDYRSIFRAATCQAMLFRYAEAAQRLAGKALPEDPRWRARFLFLTAELGREFLKQYGYGISQTVEEGTDDVTKKTPAQWRTEIRAAFSELWKMREKLLSYKTADEGDFIDVEKADVSLAPTLLDFLVLRWSGYLGEEEESTEVHDKMPDSRALLEPTYTVEWSDSLPLGSKLAVLYETASLMPSRGRELAAELWRLERIELPFEKPGFFQSAPTVEQAQVYVKRALEVFEERFNAFKFPRSRGLAGYRVALLLNSNGDYDKTVKFCRKVEKAAPGTSGGDRCAELRAGIEMPRLEFEAYPVPPGGKRAFRVGSRNVETLYFRAYKTTPSELEKLQKQSQRYAGRRQDYQYLRWIEPASVKSFLEREPSRAWELKTQPVKPYAYVQQFADFPEAEPGIYAVMVSNEKGMKAGSSLLKSTISNVSRVFLVGSSGQSGLPSDQETNGAAKSRSLRFEYYAVDGLTGAPVSKAAISGSVWDYDFLTNLSGNTESDGHLGFTTQVRGDHSSHQADVIATKDRDTAFLSAPLYAYYGRPARYELRLETDRPIYRPGQKVLIKVTGMERVPRGLHAYRGGHKIDIRVMDANYQELFKKEVKLDSFGVASLEMLIPTGRLLGSYSIQAHVPDPENRTSYSASAQFQVEEYKRPEFEVEVDPPKAPWRYGKTVSVGGSAKYYFGGPVPNAAVNYRIYRQLYIPWFCWWWRGMNLDSSRKEVATGSVKTDAQGHYQFDFVPAPTDNASEVEYPVTFSVEVDARDTGGRTLSGSREFRAGKHALLFNIPPPAGFYRERESIELKPKLVDLNEQPASGEGTYELRRVEKEPKTEAEEWRYPGMRREPNLEAMFAAVEDGPSVKHGRLKFDGAKGAALDLKGVPEGLYRVRFKAKDPWDGDVESAIILVVVNPAHKKVDLPLPGVALTEHTSYAPGETAKVLLGSSRLSGLEHVEAWGGRFLLGRRALSGGGPQLVDFEIDEEWKGGVTVRWFGAGNFEIRAGQTEIEVPWADKELKTELVFSPSGKVLKPGEKVQWSLLAKDPSGRGVDAEATFRVFDRSLEYYVKSAEPWVKTLYVKRGLEASQNVSFTPGSITDIAIERGWIKELIADFHHRTAELMPPALLLNRTRVYGRGRFGHRARMEEGVDAMADMQAAPPASMPMEVAKSSMEANSLGAERREDKKAQRQNKDSPPRPGAGGGSEVKARTNFSETAHFDPTLKITRGSGKVKFTAPEQLTSWKVDASVLTADAKWGYASGEAVTRKDLMVRVEMPRFYRENDQGHIKAVVHNESDRKLKGTIQLQVREGKTVGGTALDHLGLTGSLERSFEAKPHAVVAFDWAVSPPAGVRDFKIRAIARAGDLVDAEERILPILPSRQRLIESQVVVLDGDARKTLSVPAMKKQDASRKSELLEFRVDPQLALTVLNSLPFLVEYPYECTEQVLQRYVPTAIVDEFYSKYPALAEATKKLPKRDTIVPPWEKDDPRRLITLLETPWKQQSEGGYRPLGLVDMLDPKVVRGIRTGALETLKSYQLGNGGFPWFPGGQADPYITLVVLGGLAEAERYGIDAPGDMRDRALSYLFSELPQHLKPDPGNLSLILYGAYVTTSFERSRTMSGQALELAKAWLEYAVKHEDAMTPLGHAYAAYGFWRLGRAKEGDDQLERALDGSREDDIAGVYWTPEKISWLWYSDTLEKHAFFLRTLLDKKPKDPRIPGMVKWIMFNRKGNEWKSTKAAAAAIYSLLDVMKKRGSLDKGDEYQISWKTKEDPISETIKVGPTDWLAKPLRWAKGENAPANPTESELPKVDKKGPGYAFASLTWIYSTEELPTEAVNVGLIGVTRKYFRRVKEGSEYHLKPMASGDSLAVGDELEVHLTVTTKSQFEYVHLKDPKPAGFEAETLLSGWKWDLLARYEEPRDSLTNFFMSWVPHGEYVLKYRMRATTAGSYRIGPAVLQSMYAPEMTGYSSGFKINVTGE